MHVNVLARTTTKATTSSGRDVLFVSRDEMGMLGMIQDYAGRAYDTEITMGVQLSAQIMTLGHTSDKASA